MIIPPALQSPKFRLYFFGHLISFAGSQMQIWSLYWHLRTLSDQPMVISGIGLARFLPIIAFSLVAGVAADRFNRRKITLVTQFGLGLTAGALGWFTKNQSISLWSLFALVMIQAILTAFDVPARQALIPSLVPAEHLTSAYSLNSIASKVGGIIGPAFAGIVIASLGLEWSYWLNAISFIAVIIALLIMGEVPGETAVSSVDFSNTLADIRGGIEFIRNSPVILSAMIMDFFGSFFSSANTLLPFIATDILQIGPMQYGWLSAGQSIGTLLVAVYISQKKQIKNQGKTIAISIILFGLATILFGISRLFILTFISLILIGAFDGLSSIIRNTVRQTLTPHEMRGRMMSITQIFFKGGPQLGEVESGFAAQYLGIPLAVVTGGIGCIFASFLVIRKYPQLWHFSGTLPANNESTITIS
jgi:MFS family permease